MLVGDKGLTDDWVLIVSIHIFEGHHHSINLVWCHELCVSRKPIHGIELVSEGVIQRTDDFSTVNCVLVNKLLEECPQFVGLVNESVKSGIIC
jgi:hypothetical protein